MGTFDIYFILFIYFLHFFFTFWDSVILLNCDCFCWYAVLQLQPARPHLLSAKDLKLLFHIITVTSIKPRGVPMYQQFVSFFNSMLRLTTKETSRLWIIGPYAGKLPVTRGVPAPSPVNSLDKGPLTHWGRNKMDAISQTTFSSTFSWIKMLEFRLKFHWRLFLRVELTIFQHWFR